MNSRSSPLPCRQARDWAIPDFAGYDVTQVLVMGLLTVPVRTMRLRSLSTLKSTATGWLPSRAPGRGCSWANARWLVPGECAAGSAAAQSRTTTPRFGRKIRSEKIILPMGERITERDKQRIFQPPSSLWPNRRVDRLSQSQRLMGVASSHCAPMRIGHQERHQWLVHFVLRS